jgi:peptide/nickel transport system permease protein
MIRYIHGRLWQLVLTLLGISLLAFVLGSVAPGDPAYEFFQRANERPPTDAELEATREQLGLDGSLPEQYVSWLVDALRGDLGSSFTTRRPVAEELSSRILATLQLAVAAMGLALLIALPVGVIAAVYRNRLLDRVIRVGAMLGASIPGFWLAYLLITVFAVRLQVLPSGGRGGLEHLILPALALAIGDAAILARLMRSSLLEVLEENYIRTARAKGVAEWQVVARHGLGNALSPVVTQSALTFGWLLAYSVVIEIIFVWPGVGQFAFEAITQRDYPVLQGFVLMAGVSFVVLNLLVDLMYVWLDPRVRLT